MIIHKENLKARQDREHEKEGSGPGTVRSYPDPDRNRFDRHTDLPRRPGEYHLLNSR